MDIHRVDAKGTKVFVGALRVPVIAPLKPGGVPFLVDA
jgi:hypothetical protein